MTAVPLPVAPEDEFTARIDYREPQRATWFGRLRNYNATMLAAFWRLAKGESK